MLGSLRHSTTANHIVRAATKSRFLATVSPSFISNRKPPQPPPCPSKVTRPDSTIPWIDTQILRALDVQPQTSLSDIIGHYIDQTGNVLNVSLPYESRPTKERRVTFEDNVSSREVVTVAHCARDGDKHKIALSSGFALNAEAPRKGETLIATCGHTLEEIRASPLLRPEEIPPSDTSRHPLTATFVCVGLEGNMKVYPATEIVSSIPRSDVILISCDIPKGTLQSLPLSPYPAQPGASIRAHFVAPSRQLDGEWNPWIGDTWGKWARGNVLGYRDFAGREAKPGTYDGLSHIVFTPFPTAGSSGGPIVDEESGAVVGMMLGSRMDNHVHGVQGWGIPSETIYEMFMLPGLEGKG